MMPTVLVAILKAARATLNMRTVAELPVPWRLLVPFTLGRVVGRGQHQRHGSRAQNKRICNKSFCRMMLRYVNRYVLCVIFFIVVSSISMV